MLGSDAAGAMVGTACLLHGPAVCLLACLVAHASAVVRPFPSGIASMYVAFPPCVFPGPGLGASHTTLNALGSMAATAAAAATARAAAIMAQANDH
jgi:hypothetical protein